MCDVCERKGNKDEIKCFECKRYGEPACRKDVGKYCYAEVMEQKFHEVTGQKIREQMKLDNSDVVTILVMPCYCEDRNSKAVADDRYHWQDAYMIVWNTNYGPEDCYVHDLREMRSDAIRKQWEARVG